MLMPMLFVKDLDAMATFYRDGFGLTDDAAASSPGYLVLSGEGTRLALHALPEAVAGRIAIADPPEPRSDTAIKLLFAVDDLPSTSTRLEALGAQLFDTGDDDAHDAIDLEGNVFRVSAI